MTSKPGHRVVIERLVPATPARVYDAWTKPPLMARWLGDKVEADVRVGGRYRYENDGGPDTTYVHAGEYQVLEPHRRIVQSFSAGAEGRDETGPYKNEFIEVRLTPSETGETHMTFINGWDGDAVEGDDREALEAAWSGWLDRLANLLKPN